eukprot:4794732-Pyramimonas_sp.AAC.1
MSSLPLPPSPSYPSLSLPLSRSLAQNTQGLRTLEDVTSKPPNSRAPNTQKDPNTQPGLHSKHSRAPNTQEAQIILTRLQILGPKHSNRARTQRLRTFNGVHVAGR